MRKEKIWLTTSELGLWDRQHSSFTCTDKCCVWPNLLCFCLFTVGICCLLTASPASCVMYNLGNTPVLSKFKKKKKKVNGLKNTNWEAFCINLEDFGVLEEQILEKSSENWIWQDSLCSENLTWHVTTQVCSNLWNCPDDCKKGSCCVWC